MRLVLPNSRVESQQFANWLSKRHGFDQWVSDASYYAYGLKDGDEVRASVVLEPFHSSGSYLASISIAGPDVLRNRTLTKHALSVPFNKMFKANRVSLIIESSYTRVIRVAEILGFKIEGELPNHFGRNSGILLGMTEDPLGLVA